jgi:large subunit ribosomal protein L14e
LVDGPSDNKDQAVPRHSAALANLSLTSIVIPKLPRAIGHGPLKAKWKAAEVEKTWKESSFAKSRVRSSKRRALTDFERFKVLRLRKQVRFAQRQALAKVREAAS